VPQAGCAICLVSRYPFTTVATGPDGPRSDLLPEFWRRSDFLGNSKETDSVDAERYAIVMRMQVLWPKTLGRYEKHRLRLGGDLGHIDADRSGLNRRLIGDEDWAEQART